jgi:hypothetical protein
MRLRVKIGICVAVIAFGALGVCAAQSQPDQPSQDKPQQEQAPPNQSPQGQSPQSQQPSEPAAPSSPDTAQPTAEPQAKPPAENPTAEPQTATPATPEAPVLKRRPAHKPVHKKKTPQTQSGKVVVRNGGAREGTPELAPGTSKEQQLHKRENTNQLLATTDANLKSVTGRQLTPAQQSMMEQIRTYMSQSKAASNSGDLDRAHTLAYKAHLLSDELAKK